MKKDGVLSIGIDYKKELNNTPTVDNTETTSMNYYTEDDYSDNSDPINTDYGI